jgi:hypothetical protein
VQRALGPAILRQAGRPWFATAVCLGAALVIVLPYGQGDRWPSVHQAIRYPFLVEHFYQEMVKGVWWPRWLPDLQAGYGYPEFVFYQPLFFFLAIPFRAVFGSAVTATWCVVIVSITVGAVGAHRLCLGSTWPLLGYIGAALYVLSPYLYVDWLVRGDLSELLAMGLCPWIVLTLLRSSEGHSGNPLAITLALCILAHPAIGILMAMAAGIVWVLLLARQTSGHTLLRIAWGGLGALLLAAPYWVPFVLMRNDARLAVLLEHDPGAHCVYLVQMLWSDWGFGTSKPLGQDDGMAFPLGRLLLALSLMAAILGRRRRDVQLLLPLLLLSIFAITPMARSLWSIAPFSMMTFPWRLLPLCIAFSLALLRGFDGTIPDSLRPIAAALGLLLVTTVGWRPEQFGTRDTGPNVREFVQRAYENSTMEDRPVDDLRELLPSTVAQRPPIPHGPGSSFVLPTGELRDETRGATLRATVTMPEPGPLLIKQYYFPGWEVTIDGVRVADDVLRANLGKHGLILLWLEATPSGHPVTVTATYGHPRGALVSYVLALSTLLGMVVRRGAARRARSI